MKTALAARRAPPPAALGLLLFAIVGSVGFVVDTGVLLLVVWALHVPPLAGRVVSFFCAATVTYALNRRFIFSDGAGPVREQWLRYLLGTGIGAFLNIGLFYVWLRVFGPRPMSLVAGSAVCALIAMTFNYFIARTMVFTALAVPNRR